MISGSTLPKTRRIPEVKFSSTRLIIAFFFCVLGIILLIWNEMEAVRVNKTVTSMIEDIHIITDINIIDKNNENSLIYVYGSIEVEEPLTEPEYGLSVPAVVLKRRVQIYQWVEKLEESDDKGKNYPFEKTPHYDTEWKDKIVDSSKFLKIEGHQNPSEFPVTSHIYVSQNVKIGAYTLSHELKNKFKDFVLITSDERPERHDIKMHAGLYYHTTDVWNPKVGDIRLQFSYAGITGEIVSIIAMQTNNELGGKRLLLLEKGKVLPSQMITKEHNWNMWLIRLYRICGWICLYIGSSFAKSLFYHCARKYKRAYIFVSLDRRLSPYASLSSIILGLIVCSIWVVYKPMIGVILIAMIMSPFIWCASSLESKDNSNEYKKI